MSRTILPFIFLALLAAALSIYRTPVYVFLMQTYDLALPCTQPIPYTIGTIDPRFHIATSTVLADVKQATSVWNRTASSTLFVYDPSRAILTVNFVYDTRQETTDALAKLGLSVSDDAASYDAVKAKYTALYAQYEKDKSAFDAANASYQSDSAAYEQQVASWNAKGGAPSDVYQQLNAEKSSLQSRQQSLQTEAVSVNAEADNVNALVDELNHLASVLNIDASAYNTTGASQGSEFEQGVFESSPGHEEINIYEYDSQAKLTRVLSHEFGHSLGMEHVKDPNAIMYALDQGTSDTPTAADIAELDRVCRT